MHIAVIARVLGMLLMIFSLTMLSPIIVASIYEENTTPMFLLAFAITQFVGLAFWLPSRGPVSYTHLTLPTIYSV